MNPSGQQVHTGENRLRRLAAKIDALTEKDAHYLQRSREISALRRSAAAELHATCSGFVASVNRVLARTEILLDPPEHSDNSFRAEGTNLVQISVRGRILQVTFEATPELISTEDFRVPYTLAGAVRAFSQQLLEKDLIEEQLLFYTVERDRRMWRFFDARTYRTGPFDQEYLIALMEQLI